EPAELVRQRHQVGSPDSRLEVLFGDVSFCAPKTRFEHRYELLQDIAYRYRQELDVKISSEYFRILHAAARRKVRRHQDADHVFTAQSIHGNTRSQCGINSTAKPQYNFLEAVLLDIVASPDDERSIYFGNIRKKLRLRLSRQRLGSPDARRYRIDFWSGG